MHKSKKLRMAGATMLAAILSGAAMTGSAFGLARPGQPWKHAIIDPKGDAGFQVMAVRAGLSN